MNHLTWPDAFAIVGGSFAAAIAFGVFFYLIYLGSR